MLHPDAMLVRQEVFVEEQGFHDEFDDIDEIADHYLLYVDGEIAGCCRVFPSKDNGKYTLGRLAIRKKYRGQSYGSLIMRKVEAWIKKNSIPALELSAQVIFTMVSDWDNHGQAARGMTRGEYEKNICVA